MPRYRVRPLLSQAHYIAIGRAIATWAALEIKIDQHLLKMLQHPAAMPIRQRDNIHRLAHVPRSLWKRLGLFDELAAVIYDQKTCRGFMGISKRCLSLAKERRRLAHGEWIVEGLDLKVHPKSRMWRAGRAEKIRRFTVPQIRALTHQICDVYADLYKLSIEHPPRPPAEELREFFEARLSKTSP
jgi:hypothetical protein